MGRHTFVLAIGIIATTSPLIKSVQPSSDPNVISIEALGTAGSIYLLSGRGANSLVVVDAVSGGVVLVDTKRGGSGDAIRDVVRLVTDLPITSIINTHAHTDHTGSNGEFSSVTRIVAHENVQLTMSSGDHNPRALPTETFVDRMTLLSGENQIDLYYFGRGHTNGDIVVVFPAQDLAYFGDLFETLGYPAIDPATGGSGLAFPETLARSVAELEGISRIVTGGMVARNEYTDRAVPVPGMATLGWQDLVEYAAFCDAVAAAVRATHAAGVPQAPARAELDLPDRYDDYDRAHADATIRVMYEELDR